MKQKPAQRQAGEPPDSGQPVAAPHQAPAFVDFDLKLRIGLEQVRIRASIPQGPISLPEFVPIVQSLTDAVMAAAVRGAKRLDRSISCGPGCGACCRQLVPVGEAEAIHLQRVMTGLDEDHRGRIRERHRANLQRLRDGGLLDDLRSTEGARPREARRELGLRYFGLGLPCPFLEDESCSIHPHRPLACREYMVTSDPRYCAHPETGQVETLELPRRPSAVFYRFGDGAGSAPAHWLALTLALDEVHSGALQAGHRTFPAPELFVRFVRQLASSGGDAEPAPPGTGQR